MTATAIRERLFEYIRFADDKKVKAIYTIIEDEINQNHEIWTKEFISEVKKRDRDLESGKVKGKEWKNVKAKANAILSKSR